MMAISERPNVISTALKPINVMPVRATLLNTNKPVECIVDLVPSEHLTQKKYLRLRNLPVNEMVDNVMVMKMEFGNDIIV